MHRKKETRLFENGNTCISCHVCGWKTAFLSWSWWTAFFEEGHETVLKALDYFYYVFSVTVFCLSFTFDVMSHVHPHLILWFSSFSFLHFFHSGLLPCLLLLPAPSLTLEPAAKEAEVPRRFSLTSSLASSSTSSFATRRTKGIWLVFQGLDFLLLFLHSFHISQCCSMSLT